MLAILTVTIFLSGALEAQEAGPAVPVTGAAAGEGVFDPAPVLRIKIEIPPDAVGKLREDRRGYVAGTLHIDGTAYQKVGIRLKGSAGSAREIDDKTGFTLKFNQFALTQRFRGLKKVILNNGVQDPTYISELLGNELFRAAGVPAPRMGHARVELNGRDLGLYVVAEAVTRDFLSRWFKDPSGNLYEGPGEVDAEDLDADNRGGAADRLDLKGLRDSAQEPDPAERWRRLEAVLDIDRFLTFLAMEAITWHWDGYAVGVNNYHVYADPTSKRMVFMPHGADQLFQDPGAPLFPGFQGLVARQIVETAVGRKRYRERIEALLAAHFDIGKLHGRVLALAKKVRPALEGIEPGQAVAHDEAIAELVGRIAYRVRSTREQLTGGDRPEAGPPIEFDEKGVARPTGWKTRAHDGEAELEFVDGEGVENGKALRIRGGVAPGEFTASWRTRVSLAPGKYRFAGKVRTRGVKPVLPAPEGGEGKAIGAALRISGRKTDRNLAGDNDWSRLEFDFGVEGDQPQAVVLVCELRAAEGTTWFDERSLEIVRLPAEERAPSPPEE